MSHNGQKKQLDEMSDKLEFVSDSIVPLSTAIQGLTGAVERNSNCTEGLTNEIRKFIEYEIESRKAQAKSHELHRMDLVKVGGVLFIIIFGLLFGFSDFPAIAKAIF